MADIVVHGLTVEYRSGDYAVRPLDDLCLEMASGELVVLLGPSGCGKTTLLSCLAGILTPTAGRIEIDGRDVSALTGSDRVRHRRHAVGVVFQSFNLVAGLTALENVMLPLQASGVNRREARARAGSLLDQVGLGDRAGHRPTQLSGGQQQRVAIARALALDPPVLLADEPTAHLDYVQVEDVLRLLRDLARPGRTVIVSTHDERLLPLADRVVEMVPQFLDAHGEATTKSYADGDVIFEQASRGNRIYVVEQGEVEIVRRSASGGSTVIAVIPAGEHFGEMGPMFHLPRSAAAIARGDCVVSGYTLEQFADVVGMERLGNLVGRAEGTSGPRGQLPDRAGAQTAVEGGG